MKTLIYPDRKGSGAAKKARSSCDVLAALCLLATIAAFLSDSYASLAPALLGACIALALLASLFRVLGCIAYDLETLAAAKMVDYTDDEDDLKDN